jgi:LysR family glycine cleavage system transcriptional activator
MKDLPLNALRAFALVYEKGGVRAAARELGIAHSSVSRHLSELDAWLGGSLVRERGRRRGLTFTPQGEALGRAALLGFAQIGRVAAGMRDQRPANAVTLSTVPSFATLWLLPRLPALEAAHPKIEMSVVVDQRLDDLRAGGIDLAIRMGRGDWPEVRCEPLMDDELYPVMSPALWNRAGRPRKPEQLAPLKLLHDRDPNASWESWRAAHGPASLPVRRGASFAASDLLLKAAVQGRGVALARHRLVEAELAAGVLMRPIERLSVRLGTSYWIVLPKSARVRPAAMTVVQWLKKQGRVSSRRA